MNSKIVSAALSGLFGVGVMLASPLPGQTTDGSKTQPQQSEPAQPRQADPARQLRMLTKRLNLNADQQNQILPVLNDRAQQMQAIRSDASLSQKDRHAKMSAVRQDTEARITAVLTADQKQTYEEMQQQMRERARQNRQGSGS